MIITIIIITYIHSEIWEYNYKSRVQKRVRIFNNIKSSKNKILRIIRNADESINGNKKKIKKNKIK